MQKYISNRIRNSMCTLGLPRVLGIWGEGLFIFRELGSTGNYFQGFGEQAHSFGNLGSPAKKQKINFTLKEKPSFRLIFSKKILGLMGVSPQTPLAKSRLNVFTFVLTCYSGLVLLKDMANNFYYCGFIILKNVNF